jgi:hypothetical protein
MASIRRGVANILPDLAAAAFPIRFPFVVLNKELARLPYSEFSRVRKMDGERRLFLFAGYPD